MTRKPAVAGYFYPGSRAALENQIKNFPLGDFERAPAMGVIAPHAGYKYSGRVAAMVYSRAQPRGSVILIGPNHGAGRGMAAPRISLMAKGVWEFPGGEAHIDMALAHCLLASACDMTDCGWAHDEEHSLEVQLPFMDYFWGETAFVPIIISRIGDDDVLNLAECLYKGILKYDKPVTLAASTDMSHYVAQEEAERLDKIAMEKIMALDAKGLLKAAREHRMTMCGVQPTAVVLEVCRRLGAEAARLVCYATSGDESKDYSSVVGYSGFVIA